MNRDIFAAIKEAGYSGGVGIFNKYCGVIRKKNSKDSTELGRVVKRFISKNDIIKYIWSGKEIDENDRVKIYNKYPELSVLEECVKDFRNVFTQKTVGAIHTYIKKYSDCSVSNLKSFSNGLNRDLAAVEQAVSPYSNGVAEGNNHRLKLIKRLMYGRAKLPLLRVKVIPSLIFIPNYTQN